MEKLTLQIVTPQSTIFDNGCVEVNLPGANGRFSVLYGHMQLVSLLDSGLVEIRPSDEGHQVLKYVISQGFADVSGGSCVLLVEKAELLDDVDVEHARVRLAELQSALEFEELTDHKRLEVLSEIKYLQTAIG